MYLLAALVIKFTGFLLIDPLLDLAFGFVLVWASWSILRDATHLLMEGTPDEVYLSDVTEDLAAIDGVEDVHHAHAWALTSGRFVFSGHLRTSASADPQIVLQSASNLLQDRYGFFFSTVQVETDCPDESAAAAIDITRAAGTRRGQE